MDKPSYLLFKQCSKCGEILHIGKFHKSKNGKYGVIKVCKKCSKKISKKYREEHEDYYKEYRKIYYEENKDDILNQRKEYYDNNKEYILKRNKMYYEENKNYFRDKDKEYRNKNKEHIKEYKKTYYEENKDDILNKNKLYREEHEDYYKEYFKQYRKNNPEKCFNNSSKRRLRENNQGDGVNKEQWFEMMEFFQWRCAYSDEYIGGDSDKRTIDHIIPLTKNGEHEVWNCVPMYANYNYSKKNKNMLEWYLEQPFFSIKRLIKIYEWRIYAYWKWYKKEGE